MIDTNVIRVLVDSTVGVKRDQIVALCNEVDRLLGEKQTPPPQGKTVNVEVAVCVDSNENWMAYGSYLSSRERSIGRASNFDTMQPSAIYWLTATLPVPAEVTAVAKVEGE